MAAITRLACIHIDTPDLAVSSDFYVRGFGLAQVAGTDDAVALGPAGGAACMVLRASSVAGLSGLEFELPRTVALSAEAKRLIQAGAALALDELPFASGPTLALRDPDGTRLRLRHADLPDAVPPPAPGDRPEAISHVVVNSPNAAALTRFYVEVLGFRVADAYEKDLLTFLRADQPQHHCLGVSPGERAGLNHFAVETGDIDALMKCVGRMRQGGFEPIWGPGRHGPGGNVFCYYADPVGLVAEFTCEVLQIQDDAAWTPRVWARTPANGNVWGTGGPSPVAVSLMSGAAAPAKID